jgi:hypothetical protein
MVMLAGLICAGNNTGRSKVASKILIMQ